MGGCDGWCHRAWLSRHRGRGARVLAALNCTFVGTNSNGCDPAISLQRTAGISGAFSCKRAFVERLPKIGAGYAGAGFSLSACRSQDDAGLLQIWGSRLMATIAEKLAASLLAASGTRAISDLHRAAALARNLRRPDIAESLAEIAEAAEREWMRGAHSKHASASEKELVAGPAEESSSFNRF